MRPVLGAIAKGLDELRLDLERERFAIRDEDTRRLRRYVSAARAWEQMWPTVAAKTTGLPLRTAHRIVVESAATCLPMDPSATTS